MRTAAILLLASAAFAQDPMRLLEDVRNRVIAKARGLPRLACEETIDRAYFVREEAFPRPASCEQLAIDRKKGRNQPQLRYTDRIRIAVSSQDTRENYAWTAAPFAYNIEDILHPGIISTGSLFGYLLDVFSNPSVKFRLLAEAPETADYGFQIPAEGSHYYVGDSVNWMAAAFAGSLRVDKKSLAVTRFSVESSELPPQSSTCETSSVLDYTPAADAAEGWFVPTKSTAQTLSRDASRTESVSTIANCRQLSATAPAPAAPAMVNDSPLPPGVAVTLQLTAAIDTDTAAAGDPISATVAADFPGINGATATGRIVQLEHRPAHSGDPAHFVISLAFDALHTNGVVTPFYARIVRWPREAQQAQRIPGPDVRQWPAQLMFATRKTRLVIEPPFSTKWLTTAPGAR